MNGNMIKQAWLWVMASVVLLSGCAGEQAFTTSARPGETIMLAAGWKQNLTRNDLTVTISPQTGESITYNPGDGRVRSIMHAYPDPVSKLVVSDRAKVAYPAAGLSWDGESYNVLSPAVSGMVRDNAADQNDWSNTMVLLDLPTILAPGAASIVLTAGGVQLGQPISIDVLPAEAGSRNVFPLQNYSGVGAMIRSVERAPHFVLRLNEASGIIPHSVQLNLGRTLAAEGEPWVTHGRGDIMNILWSDNGTVLKVMMTPTKGVTVDRLSDFKFYVTGAVTGLTVDSIKAYDVSGNLLPGFSVTSEFVNN